MKSEELKELRCACCGAWFKPTRRSNKYCRGCPPRVREKAARDAYRQEKLAPRACAYCDNMFKPHTRTCKFCSDACRIKHHTRKSDRPKGLIACDVCGTMFHPISKVNKTCSPSCSRKRSYRLSRARPEEVNKSCVVCGTEFTAKRVLDVCCSKECSNIWARKRKTKTHVCQVSGKEFTHEGSGVPKYAPEFRHRPQVRSKEPCPVCGAHFHHASTDSPTYCSLACSTKFNAMRTDKDEVFARMVDFVKTARHTPCYEEILEVGEASATWARSLGWDVGTIFEAAGRKNKSLFASKFEERVYYSLIDLGLTDEQLERQKKFPGLFTISARWPLRFDFYIEHLNILVEADGEQHEEDYDSTKYLFDGDAVKASDKLKEAYAEEHGISLVRIPYSPYFKKVSKTVSQQLSPFIR